MPSQASSSSATTLSQNLQRARAMKGLTQMELAIKIGTEPMQISKWERGKHRPSDERLLALARILGVDLPWLYTERDDVAA